MGAWIEIFIKLKNIKTTVVALFMGAWIEIEEELLAGQFVKRRSLHGSVD